MLILTFHEPSTIMHSIIQLSHVGKQWDVKMYAEKRLVQTREYILNKSIRIVSCLV